MHCIAYLNLDRICALAYARYLSREGKGVMQHSMCLICPQMRCAVHALMQTLINLGPQGPRLGVQKRPPCIRDTAFAVGICRRGSRPIFFCRPCLSVSTLRRVKLVASACFVLLACMATAACGCCEDFKPCALPAMRQLLLSRPMTLMCPPGSIHKAWHHSCWRVKWQTSQ